MEAHIKTARAHFAFGCLYAAFLLFFLFVTVMGVSQGLDTDMIGGVFVMGFFCALNFAISWSARRRQNWARIASLIIAFPMLIGFPIGTLIGIYLIRNAWTEWLEPRVYSGDLSAAWPNPEWKV